MDKELLKLAKQYAEALVAYYATPAGDANRVPQERKDARNELFDAQNALSLRAEQVAKFG